MIVQPGHVTHSRGVALSLLLKYNGLSSLNCKFTYFIFLIRVGREKIKRMLRNNMNQL